MFPVLRYSTSTFVHAVYSSLCYAIVCTSMFLSLRIPVSSGVHIKDFQRIHNERKEGEKRKR